MHKPNHPHPYRGVIFFPVSISPIMPLFGHTLVFTWHSVSLLAPIKKFSGKFPYECGDA
jgi:hypothetical protein